MLGFRGPAQPSPTLGDALNAGYLYLEVRCSAATRIRPLRSKKQALALVGERDIELWQLDRRIATFKGRPRDPR